MRVIVSPIARQSRATASAAAKAAGLDAASGLRSSIVDRLLGLGQPPAVGRHGPAGRLERARAAAASNATGGSAVESNSGELGGIGPLALLAMPAKAVVMSAGRSIAASSAVRTFGSAKAGWPGRRLSRTAVIVELG